MENTTQTSPAFEKPPYYLGVSQCEDVYSNEEHYAILAVECRGILADLDFGVTPEGKALGAFIVKACNMHEELLEVIDGLLGIVVDQNQAVGNELEEREQDIYDRANALLADDDEPSA